MSSVAVLTQERFNEHRSGLLPEQGGGKKQNQSAQPAQTRSQNLHLFFKILYERAWSLCLNPKLLWQDQVRQ